MNFQILIILCSVFVNINCQNSDEDPVGTDCYTRKTHFNGTCQHMNDCPGVKSETIASRDITYCNRRQGLVCCPNRDKGMELPQDIGIQGERISDRKCKEYAKATQKEIYVGSLILNRARKIVIKDKCQHKSTGLIVSVGGINAQVSEFPHQAHLGYQKREDAETTWVCGGSLISENHVLTAAHCLDQRETGPVKFVKLGMIHRSQSDERVKIFDVDQRHKYPQYNPRNYANDIGIIKFKGKVNFNEQLYPICLPTSQLESADVIVSGFGQTGHDHAQSEFLMKVELNRFSYDECQTLYANNLIDKKTMLCYGSRKARKDSCRGDSGGPLQISNNNEVRCTYKQIGIVSFGAKECGILGFPGIYVNVFNYIDWIEDIVWNGEI